MTFMFLLNVHAWEKSRSGIKGATKLYFMYYSHVVSILLSTGLYKSAFSLPILLVKLGFHPLCFCIFGI